MTTLLIDGNNMAYRAKYTFNLSHKGVDVSVIYGVLRMINSLANKFEPSSIIVCWDGGIPEFRRQALPEYKANRHRDDDPLEYEDFLRQIQSLEMYTLPLLGVISARKDGAEADDLIYHASRIISGDIIIVTSDKDLLQAINMRTKVYSPNKDIVYTEEIVMDEFGISVEDYVHWRAIQGDSSDNISGVKGIGEKTATKLFNEFGSLTGIVNKALGINPREGNISDRLKDNINEFGFQKLTANVKVMALYADRVGAKMEIIRAVERWRPSNKDRIKHYLMRNAFASLMNGDFYYSMTLLDRPRILTDGIRCPAVAPKRVPV
jgi:DNA polymerase-1